jgi:agmatine/peptidylarginine deiminase
VIPLEVAGHEIVLDGGNFIHNGQRTAITTNRIIADNENLFVQQIRDVFWMRLNIENLLIIPVEPGDRTGHVDGIVRFILGSSCSDRTGGYKGDPFHPSQDAP